MGKSLRLALLSLIFAACSINQRSRTPAATTPEEVFYNEVFDANKQLRPQYREVWRIYQSMSEPERKDFLAKSLKDFRGDNALSPLPRLLTEAEYSELRKGVEQRAKALQLFLEDHYMGRKSYLNKIIPEEVMNRILSRTAEYLYEGEIDSSRIAFPYGPDIIRDRAGVWRVLEDNPGFIGGIGDLKKAREILLARQPDYARSLGAIDDPTEYYRSAAQRYRDQANGKLVVAYMMPPYADNEDARLKKLYADEGIIIVTPNSQNKLVSTDKGLFLESRNGETIRRQPVGFLVLNGEHAWAEGSHLAALKRQLLELLHYILESPKFYGYDHKSKHISKLKKLTIADPITGRHDWKSLFDELQIKQENSQDVLRYIRQHQIEYSRQRIPNLLELHRKGLVNMNYTPGVDFIGDKDFTVYVEELIRHYLNEEPILKNVPTHRFVNANGGLNEALLSKVIREKNDYVIKMVDGRGGDGIWVGAKATAADWKKAEIAVRQNPERFQVQEYKHLSVMDTHIVDLRMISVVDPNGTYVSPTPWGRGLPLSGDGKVNLSLSGVEVPIAIVRTPPSTCNGYLRELIR